MSFAAKRELLAQIAPRYREASKTRKTTILDEFTAATGYSRKYAVRLLQRPPVGIESIRRPRERRYSPLVQEALGTAWAAANFICAKRLVPFLPALVDALERHGHVRLSAEDRDHLLQMSPATADRILRPLRRGSSPRGRSTTRRGPLLKHRVPVRTFAQWDEKRPGFTEADLVAHCGGGVRGSFLRTLVVTDVASGWTECVALRNGSEMAVLHALGWVRQVMPFDLIGLDTDNGSEFLNETLLAYCGREGITFTRGRAYRKNDQCFVEQKNGAIVRNIVGYDRYEGEAAYRQLTELYRAVRLYVNFFQPSMKLVSKRRDGSRVQRRYDHAQTPFQRLVLSGALTSDRTGRLTAVYQALDPVLLLRQTRRLQDALWRHRAPAMASDDTTKPSVTDATVSFRADSCMLREHTICGSADEAPVSDTAQLAAEHRKRSYRRTGRSLGPRTYRTRADPFEEVRETLHEWFLAKPDCTGKELLGRLQQKYPGQFPDGTLRSLQRRLSAWRTETLLTFEEAWLASDDSLASGSPTALRALPITAPRPGTPAQPYALEDPTSVQTPCRG